jgi:hypothetical protein
MCTSPCRGVPPSTAAPSCASFSASSSPRNAGRRRRDEQHVRRRRRQPPRPAAVFFATTSVRKSSLRRVQRTRPRRFLRPEVRTVAAGSYQGSAGVSRRAEGETLRMHAMGVGPALLRGPPRPRNSSGIVSRAAACAAGPDLARPSTSGPFSLFPFSCLMPPVNIALGFEVP